jgi:hypothetical protein
MRVPRETRVSFPEPCVFLEKHACLFRNHACSAKNTHAFSGTIRVPRKTRVSLPEPCLFLEKHACLFRSHTCSAKNTHAFFGTMRVPQKNTRVFSRTMRVFRGKTILLKRRLSFSGRPSFKKDDCLFLGMTGLEQRRPSFFKLTYWFY